MGVGIIDFIHLPIFMKKLQGFKKIRICNPDCIKFQNLQHVVFSCFHDYMNQKENYRKALTNSNRYFFMKTYLRFQSENPNMYILIGRM